MDSKTTKTKIAAAFRRPMGMSGQKHDPSRRKFLQTTVAAMAMPSSAVSDSASQAVNAGLSDNVVTQAAGLIWRVFVERDDYVTLPNGEQEIEMLNKQTRAVDDAKTPQAAAASLQQLLTKYNANIRSRFEQLEGLLSEHEGLAQELADYIATDERLKYHLRDGHPQQPLEWLKADASQRKAAMENMLDQISASEKRFANKTLYSKKGVWLPDTSEAQKKELLESIRGELSQELAGDAEWEGRFEAQAAFTYEVAGQEYEAKRYRYSGASSEVIQDVVDGISRNAPAEVILSSDGDMIDWDSHLQKGKVVLLMTENALHIALPDPAHLPHIEMLNDILMERVKQGAQQTKKTPEMLVKEAELAAEIAEELGLGDNLRFSR